VQHMYPSMIASIVEGMFRVDNPAPKPGLRRLFTIERKRAGVRRRDLLRDGIAGWRTFG
jgi:electron transfer flavoprotein-quinone oxidoreductase